MVKTTRRTFLGRSRKNRRTIRRKARRHSRRARRQSRRVARRVGRRQTRKQRRRRRQRGGQAQQGQRQQGQAQQGQTQQGKTQQGQAQGSNNSSGSASDRYGEIADMASSGSGAPYPGDPSTSIQTIPPDAFVTAMYDRIVSGGEQALMEDMCPAHGFGEKGDESTLKGLSSSELLSRLDDHFERVSPTPPNPREGSGQGKQNQGTGQGKQNQGNHQGTGQGKHQGKAHNSGKTSGNNNNSGKASGSNQNP